MYITFSRLRSKVNSGVFVENFTDSNESVVYSCKSSTDYFLTLFSAKNRIYSSYIFSSSPSLHKTFQLHYWGRSEQIYLSISVLRGGARSLRTSLNDPDISDLLEFYCSPRKGSYCACGRILITAILWGEAHDSFLSTFAFMKTNDNNKNNKYI